MHGNYACLPSFGELLLLCRYDITLTFRYEGFKKKNKLRDKKVHNTHKTYETFRYINISHGTNAEGTGFFGWDVLTYPSLAHCKWLPSRSAPIQPSTVKQLGADDLTFPPSWEVPFVYTVVCRCDRMCTIDPGIQKWFSLSCIKLSTTRRTVFILNSNKLIWCTPDYERPAPNLSFNNETADKIIKRKHRKMYSRCGYQNRGMPPEIRLWCNT